MFCDNFGPAKDCPNSPWTCYFEEHDVKFAYGLQEGRPDDGQLEFYVLCFLCLLLFISFYKEYWVATKYSAVRTWWFLTITLPRWWKRWSYDLWFFRLKRLAIPRKKRALRKKIKYCITTYN